MVGVWCGRGGKAVMPCWGGFVERQPKRRALRCEPCAVPPRACGIAGPLASIQAPSAARPACAPPPAASAQPAVLASRPLPLQGSQAGQGAGEPGGRRGRRRRRGRRHVRAAAGKQGGGQVAWKPWPYIRVNRQLHVPHASSRQATCKSRSRRSPSAWHSARLPQAACCPAAAAQRLTWRLAAPLCRWRRCRRMRRGACWRA